MKVGLVAVDGHKNFPNLALMRISAWHKSQGDQVGWWNGFDHYDRVYQSKMSWPLTLAWSRSTAWAENRSGSISIRGWMPG